MEGRINPPEHKTVPAKHWRCEKCLHCDDGEMKEVCEITSCNEPTFCPIYNTMDAEWSFAGHDELLL